MKVANFRFSPDARFKWGIFLLIALIQLSVCGYIAWRWHNIQVDGIPYQWQCIPRLEHSSFGTDYIRVIFPEDTTTWLDEEAPQLHQNIYVYITRDEKGLMKVKGASAVKPPVGEDYMKASVLDYADKTVQFQVGFDRFRIDPHKADGIYDIAGSDSVLASIRMKKGDGVIEGIFINGMPLELCGSEAEKAAAALANKSAGQPDTSVKARIVERSMVPPKEET